MSATFRGAKRHEADFYKTPASAFKPLLPYLRKLPGPFWEPACGDNRLVKWMREFGLTAGGDDLKNGYDFLQDDSIRITTLTNPPFSLAQEFCDHAIRHSKHTLMLLRLNFLASVKRRDWWIQHTPSALFVLSKRPSFTEDGKTDATDYCWVYWSDTPGVGIFFL